MKLMQRALLFVGLLVVVACGSSDSTTTTSTDVDLSNTGAMVAAAFSSSGSASVNQAIPLQLLNYLVSKAYAQEGDTNTCDDTEGSPSNVTTTLTGTAGTYGSASDSVTITDAETEFCENSAGGINDNPSDLLFASFSVSSATVTCDDSTEATMSGSGIWRSRDDLGFFPQIYGTFTVVIGEGSEEVDCSIAMNEESVVESASCTDSTGDTVTVSDDVTCTIDAGEES